MLFFIFLPGSFGIGEENSLQYISKSGIIIWNNGQHRPRIKAKTGDNV
jgi:hypothetical protein